jgi:hydrogenase maturation protease
MTERARWLVAGIGNVFLGDDGFGVEVVRRLLGTDVPPGVKVADYGIRGVHLAYELLDGYDTVILVDALSRGEPPGTVYVFEPDVSAVPDSGGPAMDAHDMTPDTVLALVHTLGGTLNRVLIVGCEPADMTDRIGLSAPVEAAVDNAVRTVLDLVANATERV